MNSLNRATIVFLLLATSPAWSEEIPTARPDAVGMSPTVLARVDDALDRLIDEKKLAGGTVIVARRGCIVHFNSYGLSDIQSSKAMGNDAIYRFDSMTKPITTAAAMMLYDEGKLELDAPIGKYLPELKGLKVLSKDGEQVATTREPTVRDLMRHSAGFSDGYFRDPELVKQFRAKQLRDPDSDLAEMTRKRSRFPLATNPGRGFWYTSMATDVLAHIVEVVSEMPLDAFFRQRVFMPLDMRDTAFHVPEAKAERFTSQYRSDGKSNLTRVDRAADSRYLKKPRLLRGGSGLVSTARDYTRFLMMVANGGELHGRRVLSEESVRLMTTNQLTRGRVGEGVGFGLGFYVVEKIKEGTRDTRVGEYGWGGKSSTHFWVSPADKLIVITLEQTLPRGYSTITAIKGLIYEAIVDE